MAEYIADSNDIYAISKVKPNEIDSVIKVNFDQITPGIIIIKGDGNEIHKKFNDIDDRNYCFYAIKNRLFKDKLFDFVDL